MLLHPFEKFLYAADNGAATAKPELVESEDTGLETEVAPEPDAGTQVAEPEAEAEPELPDLSAAFEAHGLNGIPSDPTELGNQWRQMQQGLAEREQYRQQLAFLMHQQQQQLAAQQAKPVEPPKLPWELPKFNRQYMQFLTQDESGNITVKPGGDPTLPKQYQDWKAAYDGAIDKFLSDPYAVVNEAPAITELKQQLQQMQAQSVQMQHNWEMRDFERENAEWLFQPGTRNLTPAGQQAEMFRREALQFGIADWRGYVNSKIDALLARHLLEQQNAAAATAQAQQTASAANIAAKQALLNKNAGKPNRSGTFARKTRETPSQNGDPWVTLRQSLKDLPDEDFGPG